MLVKLMLHAHQIGQMLKYRKASFPKSVSTTFVAHFIFIALTNICFLVHDFFQMTKNYSLPMTREKSKKDPQPHIQVTLKPTGIYNLVSRNSGVLNCVKVNLGQNNFGQRGNSLREHRVVTKCQLSVKFAC